MSRNSTSLAAVLLIAVLTTSVTAADTRSMTRVTVGSAPAGANRATAGSAIQTAMQTGQTGLFRHSTMRLGTGGTIETLAVVENGRITDLHARKAGTFLPRRSSSGIRNATAQIFTTLVGYGIDAPQAGARRTAFLDAADGAATAPTPLPASSSCPANFATATPAKQQLLLQQSAYAGCRLSWRSLSRTMQVAASIATELFGIPAARAADWSMIYLEVSTGAFFDNWGFEYQPGEYVAVNIGGLRGVWANTGG